MSGTALNAALAIVLCSACGSESPSTSTVSLENEFYSVLAAPERPSKDRERDAYRRPDQILELAGINEGMTIADLMAGGGWYTEVLARAVGPTGKVISHNSALSDERYGSVLRERLSRPGLANVELVVQQLDALRLPPASLDAVFLVQFYHDTVWMGVDRSAMNRAVFEALKDGGVYLVIDHAAEPGSEARDVETLHRVDERLVRDEVLAAGFWLSNASQLLRNDTDSRSTNVFERSIRGKTDRFVLKFVKPSS